MPRVEAGAGAPKERDSRWTPEIDGRRGQWSVLAGLRFVLALVVASNHYTIFLNRPGGVLKLIGELSGSAAVIGFLWVSGYSIAASYERNPERFYYRRFWRIAPVYLSTLLLILPGAWHFNGRTLDCGYRMLLPTWLAFMQNVLMLQTWTVHPMAMDGPAWTLAVEVFFYALTPLVARLRAPVLIVCILVSAGAYFVMVHRHLPSPTATIHGLPALYLAWSWLSGYYYYRHRTPFAKYLLLALPVLLIASELGVYAAWLAVSAGVVLICAPEIRLGPAVRKTCDYLGDLSYPLYLVHWPVGMFVIFAGVSHSFALMIVAALAISAVILHLFDLPLRRWSNKRLAISQRSLVPA